jgi:hypothetical protein
MNVDEILQALVLAAVTALAAEDADRRLAAAEGVESEERVDLLRYSRRAIEERDRLLELSIARDREGDEQTLRRLREARMARLLELSRRERAVTER